MRVKSTRAVALLSAAVVLLSLFPVAASAQELEIEVIAEGLRNPRQLDIVDGTVLVAEAGIGGEDCFSPDPESPEWELCYGPTGRITGVDTETFLTETVIADLPSLAGGGDPEEPAGWFATGPHDVSVGPDGDAYIAMGLGAFLDEREMVEEMLEDERVGQLGTVLRGDLEDGSVEVVADIVAYEDAYNPDGRMYDEDFPAADSNPYSLIAEDDSVVVADAGGNTLLRAPLGADEGDVDAIELVASFPDNWQPIPAFFGAPAGSMMPGDPVPTAVIPDGEDGYLVGELPGFPFHPGASRVWSVEDGEDVEPELLSDGFSAIADIAIGPDDALYVLEMANTGLLDAEMGGAAHGALVRYNADGSRDLLLSDPLFFPGGMAFDEDGALYITNCGVCADEGDLQGSLLRVDGVEDADPLLSVKSADAQTSEDQPVEVDVSDSITGDVAYIEVLDRGNGAVVVSGQTITYQPEAHFAGDDRVMYRACTEDSACVVGEVFILVDEVPTGRLAGANRIETAVRVSRAIFPAGADTVVIARSGDYPDALAGGVLARAADAPILLTNTDELDPLVAEEITRLGASWVYILGGFQAVSEDVEEEIAELLGEDGETTRVGGANRFETAVEVRGELEELTGEPATQAYIAEGQHPDQFRGFPDVLSVSALAAHEGVPILLVRRNDLHPATAESLEESIVSATVIGGTAAVSAEVMSQIDEIVDDVERVGGRDRYETSTDVADLAIAAGMNPKLLYLATGANWPDALAAGPSVARDGGVLVLVHPTDLGRSPTVRTFLQTHRPFDDVDLLGGTRAISSGVEAQVRAELQ
jgi:putative cell wall-binding protein